MVHRMVLLNKNIFKQFFIPTLKAKTFEELCEHNWKPGIWATQVEVVAAATILWNVIHPLTNSLIHYPCPPNIDAVTLLKPSHFELLYHKNLHYDTVVAVHSGKVSTDKPILTGSDSETIQ